MPGAFAHLTAVNLAGTNDNIKDIDIPNPAKLALITQKAYLELGCVSPDYPYLKLADKAQNHWADCMHYHKVGDFIKQAIAQVKQLDHQIQPKAFAWLCGYLAHVITDITIHPVVELRVGPYKENAKAHRVCEMHQDTFIWQRLNLGELGYAERVRENIGACSSSQSSDDKSQLDPTIKALWQKSLQATYPSEFSEATPDIDAWHRHFLAIVDKAEEGHKLFPLARHVLSGAGLTYPTVDEVHSSYIKQLQTPIGILDYDDIFQRAVTNILTYWQHLGQAIFHNGNTSMFLNWNLDTGRCENEQLTMWSSQ